MSPLLGFVVVLLCLQVAQFSDPEDCVIELECEECVPEHMPAVTSPAGRGGELRFECGPGGFRAYPRRRALAARCDAGRYRVLHDHQLRHLLELGCREDVYEDVLHPVEDCGAPLQGRAYVTQVGGGGGGGGGGVRHLAAVCYDAERAVAVRARTLAAPPPPHDEARAPLSLLGNFNLMLEGSTRREAERLFSDDGRLTRRLMELVKHERFTFAGQSLTSGALLAADYFEEGDARAAHFASNRVAVWRSVAEGNLRLLQADVAARARRGDVAVVAGTHAVVARGAPLYLRGGRFPVARYIWTAVLSADRRRGVALVVLNDPFVTVSEIRAAVFCESACADVTWLTSLHRHRNYERPINGLVFCCSLPEFAAVVTEMPRMFNSTIQNLN